jgi:hypothetical protein
MGRAWSKAPGAARMGGDDLVQVQDLDVEGIGLQHQVPVGPVGRD